jgi:mRNA interferase MazF
VVSASHESQDLLVIPLTSHTTGLLAGEFVLADWAAAGLHTVHASLIVKSIGH